MGGCEPFARRSRTMHKTSAPRGLQDEIAQNLDAALDAMATSKSLGFDQARLEKAPTEMLDGVLGGSSVTALAGFVEALSSRGYAEEQIVAEVTLLYGRDVTWPSEQLFDSKDRSW